MQVQGIIVDVFPIMKFVGNWRNEGNPSRTRDHLRSIASSLANEKKVAVNNLKTLYETYVDAKNSDCIYSHARLSLMIANEYTKDQIKLYEKQNRELSLKIKQVSRLINVFDDIHVAECYKGMSISEFQTINWCYNLIKKVI